MAAADNSILSSLSLNKPYDYALARSLAIGAGDVSVVVRQEVKKLLGRNKNDLLKSITVGLQDLEKKEFISSSESDALGKIFKHWISAIRKKEDAEDAYLAIRQLYHELLKDHRASPTALAIASVASSGFDLERNSPLTVTPGTTGAGAGAGAVIGGVIGGLVGGPLGAGIGAAIGGAAGAAAGLCNETGT